MAGDTVSFALVITSLVLWGSWANTYKLAHHFWGELAKFELFFIGFSIGACGSCLLAIDAIDDSFWVESRWRQYHFQMALVAGAIANIGKVCITGAIEMTSMTIAIPLVLGIEIFLGTIMLYIGDPSQTNPWYLFTGVGLILMAVIFNLLYELQAEEDRGEEDHTKPLMQDFGSVRSVISRENEKSQSSDGSGKPRMYKANSDKGLILRGHVTPVHQNRHRQRRSSSSQSLRTFAAKIGLTRPNPNSGPDSEISELTMEEEHSKSCTGIFLAICSGLSLATWPVIYEIDEDIDWREFYFGFIFSLGFTSVLTLPGTGWLRGTNFCELESTVLFLGMVGGFMMSASIYLMFASQEGLHFIVSMTIVRCSPVIGAFWGIVLWDELAGASDLAMTYIALMFVLYIAALIMIALSVLTMEEETIPGSTLAQRLALNS